MQTQSQLQGLGIGARQIVRLGLSGLAFLFSVGLHGERAQALPLFTGEAHLAQVTGNGNFDFDDHSFLSVGTLDIGSNTVQGQVQGVPPGDNLDQNDFIDTFSVTLPNGLRITSVNLLYSISNLDANKTIETDGTVTLTPATLGGLFSVGLGPNLASVNTSLSLFQGSFNTPGNIDVKVTNDFLSNGLGGETGNRFDYTVQFKVAQGTPVMSTSVPEPTSLLLFGAGLASLGLVRRRRSGR